MKFFKIKIIVHKVSHFKKKGASKITGNFW